MKERKKKVKIKNVIFADNKLVFIGGPCVIENEESSLRTAEKIKEITERLKIPFIFKSSYLKDNRSSELSYQGPGIDDGLRILERVKKEIDIPVLSDVHTPHEVDKVKDVLDIIQLPAFLSMQTSLTIKIAKTGKPVNIKKSQFLAPSDIENVIGKIERQGNENILITERGTFFGYHNLIVDIRSFQILNKNKYPIIFDAGHSVRNYGIPSSDSEGGNRKFIPLLIRAALSTGFVDALFLEVHKEPSYAKCDASTQWPLNKLEEVLLMAKESFEKGKELLHKYGNLAI